MRELQNLVVISCLVLASGSAIADKVIVKVQLNGVPSSKRRELLDTLSIYRARNEAKLSASRLALLADNSINELKASLNALGYYNATVESKLEYTDLNYSACFNVNMGPPTYIRDMRLEIKGTNLSDAERQEILKQNKLALNTIIVHKNYEETKELLLAELRSRGYLQAKFSNNVIQIDRARNSAKVSLVIDSGPLYYFGNLNYQDTRYPQSLLDRYAPFKTGDPYTLASIEQFQQNLEQADLFSKIRFDPKPEFGKTTIVPMTIRLNDKPRNRYSGSIGYGTDTGYRLSTGWLHRRARIPGHKVDSKLSLSKIKKTARLDYIIPGKRPATDSYTVGGAIAEEQYDNIYSRHAETYAVSEFTRSRTTTVYSLRYFTETFKISRDAIKLNKDYLLPGARYTWVNANTIDDYSYGTRLELNTKAGLQALASDHNLLHAVFSAKQIWPVADNTRLLLRANFGFVASNDFATLPPSLRFFTGGDSSVRGYAYNSLGPRQLENNPNFTVTGGRYLLVASAEIERRIYDKFSVAAFYDTGNASLKFMGELAKSAGCGIRYQTPIGNLRLDIAKPFSFLHNKHWRIHFSFGYDL